MNSVEKEALSDAIVSANDVSGEEDRATKTNEMTYNLAKWRLRRDVPLAILAWIGVLYIVLMSAQHIGRTLLVVVIAALLAYALTPAVTMFERIIRPLFLAISVFNPIVLGGIGGLLYLVIQTAIVQFNGLYNFVNRLITSGGNSQLNSIIHTLGIQPSFIELSANKF